MERKHGIRREGRGAVCSSTVSMGPVKAQADSDEAFEIEINNAPAGTNSGARTPTKTVLEGGAQRGEQEEGRGDGALRPDGRSLFGRRRCLHKPGTQTGPLQTREGGDQHGKKEGEKTHTHTQREGKEADGVHAQSAPMTPPTSTTTPATGQRKMAKEKTLAHTHTRSHTYARAHAHAKNQRRK